MRAAFRALRRCSGAARPRLRADARWTVFCDLDGVLADFERRVIEVTGRAMDDMKPSEAWPQLARHRGFFEHLDWTADGRTLWNHLRAVSDPIVLTGLPRGRWAEPQKRAWCRRELGADVRVLCCPSAAKHKYASAGSVLIDDKPVTVVPCRERWEASGGVFITHRTAEESIREFDQWLERMHRGGL
eukprot:TRINITY_DN12414_c0_g1_i3.p2 TRINITY_DN12414_c0_g1~~TRINITY_DN12414_c0_g1_i3.p2  ORF type:complete len:204 (+),score=76.27 TRINITY_DN12414_c0_g1_i3:54-614(+)